MNSDELFEIAYCKGKRESMKSTVMWLKEHAGVSRKAVESGMEKGKVLETLLDPDLYIESVPEDRSSFFCNSTPFIPVLSKKPSISTAMRQI